MMRKEGRTSENLLIRVGGVYERKHPPIQFLHRLKGAFAASRLGGSWIEWVQDSAAWGDADGSQNSRRGMVGDWLFVYAAPLDLTTARWSANAHPKSWKTRNE